MEKREDARSLLQQMQVPIRQQSDICCYTLLAMACIKHNSLWSEATNEWIRIHDIIAFMYLFSTPLTSAWEMLKQTGFDWFFKPKFRNT